MSFKSALKATVKESGLTHKELAYKSGVNQKSIENWLSTKSSVPNSSDLYKICKVLKIPMDSLFEDLPAHKVQGKNIVPYALKGDDFVEINYYNIKASAGNGLDVENYSCTTVIPILKSFIHPYNPKTVKMLEITGDSMAESHLITGDLVFFVPTENPSDGIFVIGMEDKLFVKRLEIDVMGKELRIISDNKRYEPKIVRGEEMNRVRIIGKVIGWIHRHPY